MTETSDFLSKYIEEQQKDFDNFCNELAKKREKEYDELISNLDIVKIVGVREFL